MRLRDKRVSWIAIVCAMGGLHCGNTTPAAPSAIRCPAGFVDLDRAPSNGCECKLVSEEDEPDPEGVDANCDGIDGVLADAIFVDQVSGKDEQNGSRETPVASLGKGLELAVLAQKKAVYVSEGEYRESITMVSGISIYGGFSRKNGWVHSPAYTVSILGSSKNIVVDGQGIDKKTVLGDLTVKTSYVSGKAGDTAIGVACESCGGLQILRSQLISVAGFAGKNGENGTNGASGSSGEKGHLGYSPCPAGYIPPDPTDGQGGAGAASPPNGYGYGGKGGNGGIPGAVESGQHGQNGGCSLDGMVAVCLSNGGAGGAFNRPGVGGRGGLRGGSGSHGSGGTQQSGALDVARRAWVGENGLLGIAGGWGGGGGGGGGSGVYVSGGRSYPGGGGGGGGAGGAGGEAGQGGQAGGASISLLLINSQGVQVTDSLIQGGAGGNGGAGGMGGNGGAGGAGGLGNYTYTSCGPTFNPGRDGGPGGAGGAGGHGGGGAGGPSYAIYTVGSTIEFVGQNNQIVPGTGGKGGASPGMSGQDGQAWRCNEAVSPLCNG